MVILLLIFFDLCFHFINKERLQQKHKFYNNIESKLIIIIFLLTPLSVMASIWFFPAATLSTFIWAKYETILGSEPSETKLVWPLPFMSGVKGLVPDTRWGTVPLRFGCWGGLAGEKGVPLPFLQCVLASCKSWWKSSYNYKL